MTALPDRPDVLEDWHAVNDQYLAAQLDRIRACLDRDADGATAGAALRRAERHVALARARLPDEAALDLVARAFGLSPFEVDILLLTAGVEIDGDIANRCATVNGTATATYATVNTALVALPDPHWSALARTGPLRHWRLVEVADHGPFTTRALGVDERVVHFLLGVNALDARLDGWVRRHPVPTLVAAGHRETALAIAGELDGTPQRPPVIQLVGDDRDGRHDTAALVAEELGLALYIVDAAEIPARPTERVAFQALWFRESVLLGAALLIDLGEAPAPVLPDGLSDQFGGLVFVSGRDPVALERDVIRVEIGRPSPAERSRLWAAALGADTDIGGDRLLALAGQYRLGTRAISRAAAESRTATRGGRDAFGAAAAAAAIETRHDLGALAKRVRALATWHDLVVPADVLAALHDIAGQVRARATVYEAWGFGPEGARGLGISAMFAGESGTGKTMAAEVLANELDVDLFRVDLSAVVSKYIGETEKNLSAIFDAAEDGSAILLFDEADALFGKRSEVRDSHDRYANVEVSYLLQRMEEYTGLAILTTNAKPALDRAFQRRLRFVIQFPFPDAADRERIWRVVFPAETPLGRVDWGKLARLNISGGSIRAVAMNAAFKAAASGQPIGMSHLLDAARTEYARSDRMLTEAETRGWA